MNYLANKFMQNMKRLDKKDYMFNIITYGIAPTISGHKCATLINFSDKYMDSYAFWKRSKDDFICNIPIKYYELNVTENTYTVLFYDEESINSILRKSECKSFLKNFGYNCEMNISQSLDKLKNRYKNECPHEIGLFLDIPLHDVLGFIKYSGKNYLYCGYWKVYDDVEGAKQTFDCYNQSKRKVMELVSEGNKAFDTIEFIRNVKA